MASENILLDQMATALRSEKGSLKIVLTFTHGRCVQVYDGRRKVGPVLIPGDGQTLADVLHMLGRLVERDVASAAERWVADESVEASDLGRGVAGF